MPSSPRATRLRATILDPDPIPEDTILEGLQELAEIFGVFAAGDARDHFAFGPCYITSTHTGPGIDIRPAYSYLDLHGDLGGTGTGTGALESDGIQGGVRGEEVDADVDADYDRLDWTVIDIPVRNVVDIALSTELDLAVVISCVFPWQSFIFSSLIFVLIVGPKKTDRTIVEFEGQEEETCHLTVRPLRLDGTPHPCAMVPTMRFSATGTSASQMTRAQVLGDYLLLWIAGAIERHSVAKIYMIAWKQGSITLVSSVLLFHDHLSHWFWY